MSKFRYDFTPEEIRKVIFRWFIRFAFAFISAWIVQVAWAYSLAEVFDLPRLNYLQAFALYILSRAILGWPELSRSVHRLWLREMNIRDRAFLTQLFIQYVGADKTNRRDTELETETPPTTQASEQPPRRSSAGGPSAGSPTESGH